MKQIVLGTAGHIDHGKTTLIKALTGIETDRLKEEKARGITIELGFAHLDLPSGLRLGIVDVPGHEKFVKNMVAGAAGIDLVALVIAADEGVMPQTREHLDICRLLGVSHGLVVLTKIDMVDEEWLELVQEDVAEYVSGTFLEGAPILPVSSTSGQGVPELVQALDEMAQGIDQAPASGPFRLPVDRVFTMKGFGTVITGTSLSGRVELGQEVEIYPSGLAAKVRGLQVHNQEMQAAERGQRTAMNLQGLDKAEINRGEVVASRGSLKPSLWLDLDLTALPGMARPLKHRAPIRFHAGAAEYMGRIMLLDRDEIRPGERVLCQTRLESPAAVMTGDRFVIRSYSPVDTVAGGVIIHPHSQRYKRNRDQVMEELELLRSGSARERLALMARRAGPAGISPNDLVRLIPMPQKERDALVQDMLARQELVRFDKETGQMAIAQEMEDLTAQAVELVAAFHQQSPLKPGMPREELKQRLGKATHGALGAKLFGHLMAKLVSSEKLVADKDLLRLPDHQVRLAGEEQALQERLLKAFAEGGDTPPNAKDLLEGVDPKLGREVLGVLVNQGDLVRVKEGLYYHAPALEGLKDRLVAHLKEHEKIATPEFKQITGLSRKYLIPLLEYFDSTQLTMRLGDERVLRKK